MSTEEEYQAWREFMQKVRTVQPLMTRSASWKLTGDVDGYTLVDYICDTEQIHIEMEQLMASLESFLARWPDVQLQAKLATLRKQWPQAQIDYWKETAQKPK
jgi:hypothetical protein